jgi:anthranilate phosphoribosyltransferase
MRYANIIKQIGHCEHGVRNLEEEQSYRLYCALLDGGVPELELGAILLAFRMKTESVSELLGFYRAVDERLCRLEALAPTPFPVVIPSYNGPREQPNLLPLLALLLARFGIPVLIHGTLNGNGRVASAYILRELGVMPCVSANQIQQALGADCIAFAPTAALAPGLAALIALRSRLGVRNSAHTLVKLIDPFDGLGVRLVGVSHPGSLEKIREFFLATGGRALLLRGTEGEAFASSKRRPRMEYIEDGTIEVLFEQEAGPLKSFPHLCPATDASSTAAWIRQALAGEALLPLPLVNQLACCLYACGYADDMNQAKAIVAVETGNLMASDETEGLSKVSPRIPA